MSARSPRRGRTPMAFCLAVAITALSVTGAEARLTPPAGGASGGCTSQPAGYSQLAGNKGASGWVWDGKQRVETCITKGTGGKIWASSQLSSPYNPSVGTYDRFTNGWTVRLQGCSTRSATTLETTNEFWDNHDHPTYDVGARAGSWYYFHTIYTPNHADSYAKYRVWARSVAGVVVGRNVFELPRSLSVNGFESGLEDFYSPCMTI
jgi:hypothetical protein